MEYFSLSCSQKNIVSLEKVFPGTSVSNICATIHMEGDVDYELLQESLHLVLQKDKTLHIRLLEKDRALMQYYAEYRKEEFSIYDFSRASKEGFETWEKSEAEQPFSLDGALYQFKLFRRGEGRGGFLMKLHHLIGDGWSAISLCNKIGNTYLGLLEGKEISFDKAPDYKEYVEEEQKYLSSRMFGKDETYWKDVLKKGGEPALFKTISSAEISPVGRRVSYELPERLNQAVYRYCEEKRVSPFAVFYMALAVYLRRTGTEERFAIGVPILNRTNYKWKQTTGMFVTTLPFYNEIKEEWTFDEFNENLRDSWYELLKHQRYPYPMINQMAGGDGRLFHVALSYQDGQFMENRNPAVTFSGKWHYCGYQAEQLTIHMTSLFENRKYAIDYDYLVQYFSEEEIKRLHYNLCQIMTEALACPDRPLKKLSVLCSEQKEQVLYTFNQTDRYIEEMPVYDSLVKRNQDNMNRTAVICGNRRMSYRELLIRSTCLAERLEEYVEEQGDLIGILLPREENLLVAMAGILQAGGAYVVLSEEFPKERIKKIIEKSGAKALVTNIEHKNSWNDLPVPCLVVDDIQTMERLNDSEKEFKAEKEKPLTKRQAYVVYTSGSTGEPKGVEITHKNLMNLAQEMKEIYGEGAVLSVCNTGFDAFMLESIVALLNGRTIVFPGREELESPSCLASLIKGYRVGSMFLTPSRLSAFMLQEDFCKALGRMECIVCGGEAFPQELLRKLRKYTHGRIYNQYGPSETTVAVSMKELSRSGQITAGSPMGNCRIYILDQWMNPVPVESCGHVYIGGSCVGQGYRNKPNLTEKVFKANPFVVGEQIYDTGDMGYWTPDGELVLTGRRDDQVKLRGLRIEPGEVSACIESYHGITSAVAVVREINGQQVLGVYYCGEDTVDETSLLLYAAAYLPKYMVPAFVMAVEEIPISANGKADIHKLPLPDLSGGRQGREGNVTENKILNIFRDVLKAEEFSLTSDYFLFGGNSLNAMECMIKIEEETGYRIRVADLYACRTAERMAAFLVHKSKADQADVWKEEKKNWKKADTEDSSYPMTPVQQGMYIQSMMDPSGLSYNMPGAFLLPKKTDFIRLEEAFVKLIEADPIFRTSYRQGREGLRAYIRTQTDFHLEEIKAPDLETATEIFLRPFDLAEGSLLRGALWHEGEDTYLFLDSHHIVGDGMSTPLLLERLNLAYQGEKLAVRWNYYDYIANVVLKEEKEEKKRQLSYWKKKLSDLPETLKLPTDYSNTGKFDYKGRDLEHILTKDLGRACEKFCREKGISEFVLFLAAYGILLSEISGREDFVIGAPAAGRMEKESREIVGPFINTMPLRLKVNKNGTVKELFESLGTTVREMLDHQKVSLEEIIQELHLPRGQQNSLYQVMMTQSPVDENAFVLGDERMMYHPISTGYAKMDLILDFSKSGEDYKLRFSYGKSLFMEETIAFYGRCMEQILGQLIQDENQQLKSLSVLAAEDYKKYVQVPNETNIPFEELPVHTILKKVSSEKGEEACIIYHNKEYSHHWLEGRAGAVAQFIEEKGVKPGTPIGLCLSRTPDMIAAMYGVLKAGCAYVFMLPTFPEARLSYMTEISGAGLVFYDDAAFLKMPSEFFEKLAICKAYPLPKGEHRDYVDRPIQDSYLVNVLFTSGSTGKPKGVMLRHRSISNLYSQMETLLAPIEGRVLCSTNSVFDCFVVETVIALALGRCVVLADEEEMMLPWKLAGLVSKYHTAVFEMTPSRLQMCLGNEAFCEAADHIGIVLLGGEVVTKTLMEKFYEHSHGILMNMYGPTEATVFTTMEPLVSGEHITIGSPLQNTRTYVLDEQLRPVIPTGCGELYIAGECLAEGYINRPELNEVSFIDDVYFPGEKMYRSGDLVRLRVDGRFDYIGRKDAQVKLNGQRVELSEISGAILESGLAAQAAVVPLRKEDGSMELCAFYEGKGKEDPAVRKEMIKSHMKKVLPVYMIPSRLTELKNIPMTATNKIDLQQLKAMAAEGETVVKEENSSNYILSIWNKVLSHPATDVNVSFFELGGTSMDALNVLSYYFNDKYEMTISQFYDNPTAAMQEEFLLQKEKKTFVPMEKAVFVTGATGFFGVHLVKELLDQNANVICLMRDGSEDRLKECLNWYFGKEYVDAVWNRIQVVKGNIREDNLAMERAAYEKLACRIDEIYHCAADVRHYAPDEEDYLKTNLDGTSRMLELAKVSGAAFYHMSTCSVAGDFMKEKKGAETIIFTEEDYDIGQNWEDNIYVKSKFLAEGLVLKAIEEGMEGKIFRLGRLVGRASDGRFQKNPKSNSFYLHVQGISALGVIPENMKEMPVDLMPIDTAAKEVMALRAGEHPVYHIMSHMLPKMFDAVKSVNSEVKAVTDEELNQILGSKMKDIPRELLPFLFELKMGAAGDRTGIIVTNQITVKELEKLGFRMELPGPEQLLKDFRG